MATALEDAQTRLAAYKAAELTILTSGLVSTRVGEHSSQYQTLAEIRAGIRDAQSEVDRLTNTTRREFTLAEIREAD